MTDLLILGSDTDAGKTTFALLWLTVFADRYAYWKPVETGESDTDRVRRYVPGAVVHAPTVRFRQPVAPARAARGEDRTVPSAAELAASRPLVEGKRLLIETFGSPLSPLTETELQLALIQRLAGDTVLVISSAVGAIGRTLQALHALAAHDLHPLAVVLMGDPDPFAVEQIVRHWPAMPTYSLSLPRTWDIEGIAQAAREQACVLQTIASLPPLLESFVPPQLPARDLVVRDRMSVWHPYTSLRDPDAPLVCVGAEAEFLELADGRRVIDGISSWWTILHGHRHPVLMAALRAAARAYDHVHFAGVTHPAAIELAELLLRSAPWRHGRVFYSDNGSTAVEVALKMAYQFWCHRGQPQRTCFVGLEGGYHGDTFGAMAVSRDPLFFGRFEPLLFRAEIVPVDAARLDDVLSRCKGNVAGVIVEPLVQGAGGFRMHTPAELRALYEVARRHGVLFLADEVMTCGGRTGTLWAHQAAGIAPDLICAAKTLAGGVLSLAATLAAPEIVAAWDTDDRSRTFFHGHSFTAHPLACAVAVANWKMLTAGPLTAPQRMESFWREALSSLYGAPHVRDVRIRGVIAAVELDLPGGYLAAAGRQLRLHCLEHGVLLRPLGSVLYALPPYCTSEDSLAKIAAAMKAAIARLARRPWVAISMAICVTFLLGYLIGGVPFGYLVARWRGINILRQGSGNIGATNVGRILGRRFGLLVFCLDFAKGALPVLAAQRAAEALGQATQVLGAVAGLAAFLGHVFPVYLRFRGGKGVATGAGVVAVLVPMPTLAALLVWVTAVCATRYVSVASLAAAATLCIVRLVLTSTPLAGDNLILTLFCLVAAALVFVRHRGNIGRLLRGQENRLKESLPMQLVTRTLHVLAVGLWFGSAVFFTFVVALTLFDRFEAEAAKERQERPLWLPLPAEFDQDAQTRKEQGTRAAGAAISPMFDWYFLIQGVCGLLAAGTALGWPRLDPTAKVHRWRTLVLLAALLTVVVGWPLERKVSTLRAERNKASDALLTQTAARPLTPSPVLPGDLEKTKQTAEAARAEFGRWHFLSLMLNFVTVALVTVAMALTASLPCASPLPKEKNGERTIEIAHQSSSDLL